MASACASQDLDLNRFNAILDEYCSSFHNPPHNTQQLVQFCKDKQYNYKYNVLNPHFSLWTKLRAREAANATTSGTDTGDVVNTELQSESSAEIDWDTFWTEYEAAYKYPPKKAVHLWNFAKTEKHVTVKYKEARIAFDRLHPLRSSNESHGEAEGCSPETVTDNVVNPMKTEVCLRITRYTKDKEVERIRESFLECFDAFRSKIMHDPRTPKQLFNFINDQMQYKVRYGDVKSAYDYALEHQWFTPMKRKLKRRYSSTGSIIAQAASNTNSSNNDCYDDEGDTNSDTELAEEEEQTEGGYVLEVDHEKLRMLSKEEEEKAPVVYQEHMTDEAMDELLRQYQAAYANPPRSASQIMNFAKEIGQLYKYKACRIAFHRWVNLRGKVMPAMIVPGTDKEEEEEEE